MNLAALCLIFSRAIDLPLPPVNELKALSIGQRFRALATKRGTAEPFRWTIKFPESERNPLAYQVAFYSDSGANECWMTVDGTRAKVTHFYTPGIGKDSFRGTEAEWKARILAAVKRLGLSNELTVTPSGQIAPLFKNEECILPPASNPILSIRNDEVQMYVKGPEIPNYPQLTGVVSKSQASALAFTAWKKANPQFNIQFQNTVTRAWVIDSKNRKAIPMWRVEMKCITKGSASVGNRYFVNGVTGEVKPTHTFQLEKFPNATQISKNTLKPRTPQHPLFNQAAKLLSQLARPAHNPTGFSLDSKEGLTLLHDTESMLEVSPTGSLQYFDAHVAETPRAVKDPVRVLDVSSPQGAVFRKFGGKLPNGVLISFQGRTSFNQVINGYPVLEPAMIQARMDMNGRCTYWKRGKPLFGPKGAATKPIGKQTISQMVERDVLDMDPEYVSVTKVVATPVQLGWFNDGSGLRLCWLVNIRTSTKLKFSTKGSEGYFYYDAVSGKRVR